MKTRTLSVFILGALLVAGCGGGGSSNNTSNNGGGSSATNLSLSTTPTAKLANSQTNANALVAELQADGPKLVAVTRMQDLPIALSKAPTGSNQGTLQCAALTGTGLSGISGSISYTSSLSSPPAAGDSASLKFQTCMFSVNGVTIALTGETGLTYTRYSSLTNYALQFSYKKFSISATGGTEPYQLGPLTGGISVNVSGSGASYTSNLADGSATNISGTSDVSYSGTKVTIASATYVYNSPAAGGIIKLVFNNWVYDTSTNTPVSGTVTITGANGDTVQVDATNRTVTYTISGTVTSYSY